MLPRGGTGHCCCSSISAWWFIKSELGVVVSRRRNHSSVWWLGRVLGCGRRRDKGATTDVRALMFDQLIVALERRTT